MKICSCFYGSMLDILQRYFPAGWSCLDGGELYDDLPYAQLDVSIFSLKLRWLLECDFGVTVDL